MTSDRSNTSIATLEKLSSKDGFWNIREDQAQIGKIYMVDLDSIRTVVLRNKPSRKDFRSEVIDVIQNDGEWKYFPTELLRIGKT